MNLTPVQFQRPTVQVSNHSSLHKQQDKPSANNVGITELKLGPNSKELAIHVYSGLISKLFKYD